MGLAEPARCIGAYRAWDRRCVDFRRTYICNENDKQDDTSSNDASYETAHQELVVPLISLAPLSR